MTTEREHRSTEIRVLVILAQFEQRQDNVRGVANEINIQGAVESKITLTKNK